MNCNQYNKKDYTSDDIRSGIMSALYELYRRDKALLSMNANEPAITHRFAKYIENEFSGWNVDCEYNRDGDNVKRNPRQKNGSRVIPDIIVHKRGTKGENLIVIEAKKDNSNDLEEDKGKIKNYLDQYGYKSGLFIVFNVTQNPITADLFWLYGNEWENEVINFELDPNKKEN